MSPSSQGRGDLGHDDRTGLPSGPEHAYCNQTAPHRCFDLTAVVSRVFTETARPTLGAGLAVITPWSLVAYGPAAVGKRDERSCCSEKNDAAEDHEPDAKTHKGHLLSDGLQGRPYDSASAGSTRRVGLPKGAVFLWCRGFPTRSIPCFPPIIARGMTTPTAGPSDMSHVARDTDEPSLGEEASSYRRGVRIPLGTAPDPSS